MKHAAAHFLWDVTLAFMRCKILAWIQPSTTSTMQLSLGFHLKSCGRRGRRMAVKPMALARRRQTLPRGQRMAPWNMNFELLKDKALCKEGWHFAFQWVLPPFLFYLLHWFLAAVNLQNGPGLKTYHYPNWGDCDTLSFLLPSPKSYFEIWCFPVQSGMQRRE